MLLNPSATKTDIQNGVSRLKAKADLLGIRLGKSESKAQELIAAFLDDANFNTTLGKAQKQKAPHPVSQLTNEDLDSLNVASSIEVLFTTDSLSNHTPRTLLYGYTCDRNTWHVYLDEDGFINKLVYNSSGARLNHDRETAISFAELIPNKRAYPNLTDLEFAKVCFLHGFSIPFTTHAKQKSINNANFFGLRLSETHTPSEHFKVAEAISDKLMSWHFAACAHVKLFGNTHSLDLENFSTGDLLDELRGRNFPQNERVDDVNFNRWVISMRTALEKNAIPSDELKEQYIDLHAELRHNHEEDLPELIELFEKYSDLIHQHVKNLIA